MLKYIIYAFGLIYLLISFNYGINIYGEGLTLVGGMRVLGGDIPYKDFWTIYAPGVYYFSSFLQLFTQQIIFEKLIAVLIVFVTAIKLNDIYSVFTEKKGYSTFIAVVLLAGFGIKFLNASGIGIITSVCSILFGLKYFKLGEKKDLIKSSLFIGLTAIFRHDYAIYLIIPFVLSIIFDIDKQEKIKSLLLMLYCLIPAALFYAIFGFFAGYGNMIEQMVIFPLTKFSSVHSLPFPLIWEAKYISNSFSNYFFNVWIALVFLVPPLIAIVNYILFRKNKYASLHIYYGLIVLLFYNQALNQSDYSHLMPSLLLSLPLLFSLLDAIISAYNRRTATVVISLWLFIIPLAKKTNNVRKNYLGNTFVKTDLPHLSNVYIDEPTNELYHYIAELKQITLKDEPTFIGLKDMSSIAVNDVLIYYVLGFKPHTKYHELHPGIADREQYQKKLLNELAQKNKYLILLNIEPENRYNGSQYFKEHLLNNFRYIIKTHSISVLENKNKLNS